MPNGALLPVPSSYPPLPEQEPGHEFMNAPDVQRLLRTMDPTRPPDQPPGTVPVPPPARRPRPPDRPTRSCNGDAADRMLHIKSRHRHRRLQTPAPAAASPAAPVSRRRCRRPAAPSDNSFLQQGDADPVAPRPADARALADPGGSAALAAFKTG